MNTIWKSALAILPTILFACANPSGVDEAESGDLPAEVPSPELAGAAANSGFVAATASSWDPLYPPSDAIDGSLSTRWTAFGKGQFIAADMGAVKNLSGMRISWYRGNLRKSTFSVMYQAADGSLKTAFSGVSSGTTSGLETYTFPAVATRYIRVVVQGNTENDNANMWEMQAVTDGSSTTTPPPAASVAVAVTPATASLTAGGSVQLNAAVTGSTNTSVTWSIQEGAAGGAVSSTGLYTASSSAGTYHVVATAVADTTKKASATVTVTAPVGVTVAKPTGGDDTANFNAAIVSANGNVVNVPSGTYNVRAVAVNRAGTTILCSSSSPAVIKLRPLASGDGSPIFNVTAANFTLKNCILDGNKSAQAGYPEGFNDSYNGRRYRAGIWMSNASGLTVSSSTFRNLYGAAITTREVNQVEVSDSTFRDNYFEALFASTSTVSGTPNKRLTGLRFLRNTVVNARSGHGSVNSNGAVVAQYQDVVIDSNLIDGVERNGFKLENCAGTSTKYGAITNNDFRNTDMFGALGFQSGVHYFNIDGNKFTNVAAGIGFGAVVSLQYPSDTNEYVNFTNNNIVSVHSSNMPDGFQLIGYGPSMHHIRIDRNTISNVPRDAVQIRQTTAIFPNPTAYDISITNNTVTSASRCVNIYTSASSGYVTPTNVTNSGNTCK